MPNEQDLIVSETEISNELPLGLRYFLAVDAIVGTDPHGNMRGQLVDDIRLYGAGENQSRVFILRNTSHYDDRQGEITAKQDEIRLEGMEYLLQFNAEMQAGRYSKYPANLSYQHLVFLQNTVDAFAQLAQRDGSFIMVNMRKKMVAKNGVWEEYKEEERKKGDPPTLPSSKKELPPGKPALRGPVQAIDLGAVLNEALKLKQRQPQRT